ncbi:MAG: hypothetical protein OXC54_01250 [Rhodospirillaceae bacterium]|nr:hypothetical protein [Rhodospirillaceae bacterium]
MSTLKQWHIFRAGAQKLGDAEIMGILIVELTLEMPTFLTPMSGMVALSFRRIVSLVGGGTAFTERIPDQSICRNHA